jgi:DNA-binding CsgD family transcriptional regulator
MAESILSQFPKWRIESEKCSCVQDKIGLLTRLIDHHVLLALIICNKEGQVLWANGFATSVAESWGIFNKEGSDFVVTNESLKKAISDFDPLSKQIFTPRFFGEEKLFFEASLLSVSGTNGAADIIGLAIDCHELTDGCEHKLDELSFSEYRLMKKLESHRSLKESARDLNISYENARTKLKHIFEKLDVHSQSELLSKVRHNFDKSGYNGPKGQDCLKDRVLTS